MNQYSVNNATKILLNHYTKQFALAKDDIVQHWVLHKIRHSYEVLSVIQRLLMMEDTTKKMSSLFLKKAEIVALLHDIGRFYQWKDQNILSDKIMDHGHKSCEIMKDEGYKDVAILLSVNYHNKYGISGIEREEIFVQSTKKKQLETVLLAKLLRDADKIQNLEYIMYNPDSFLFSFEKKLSDIDHTSKKVSDKVLDEFLKENQVDKKYRATQADNVLYVFSWIFDLHFDGCYALLKSYGFVCFVRNILQNLEIEQISLDKIITKIEQTIA